MKTVTISEAKAKLSGLVEAAQNGEQVLIMRGSRPAVTLVPVHEEDLVIWPPLRVTDRAADTLLAEASQESASGRAKTFESSRSLRKYALSKQGRS